MGALARRSEAARARTKKEKAYDFMLNGYRHVFIRCCLQFRVFGVACLLTTLFCGCKQDLDRLGDNLERTITGRIEDRIEEMEGKIEAKIDDQTKRIARIERLKMMRAEKVAAMERMAELLATAKALEADALAFKKHADQNERNQEALSRKPQSPGNARAIGSFEAYTPYVSQYRDIYASLLPGARRVIFEQLDRYHRYQDEEELKEVINTFVKTPVDKAWESAKANYERGFEQRTTHSLFASMESVKKAAPFFWPTDFSRAIWEGPTLDELKNIDIK